MKLRKLALAAAAASALTTGVAAGATQVASATEYHRYWCGDGGSAACYHWR